MHFWRFKQHELGQVGFYLSQLAGSNLGTQGTGNSEFPPLSSSNVLSSTCLAIACYLPAIHILKTEYDQAFANATLGAWTADMRSKLAKRADDVRRGEDWLAEVRNSREGPSATLERRKRAWVRPLHLVTARIG